MGLHRVLRLALLSLATLAGCSPKRETPTDVPVFSTPAPAPTPTLPSEQPVAEGRQPPVTTAKDELGELLRKWWAEGTAAGNVGDFYDNRDRGHSSLNV